MTKTAECIKTNETFILPSMSSISHQCESPTSTTCSISSGISSLDTDDDEQMTMTTVVESEQCNGGLIAQQQTTRLISRQEVEEHNSQQSAWVIMNDCVYDVTRFLEMHPGGEDVILCMAGADITGVFMDVGHSIDALLIMQTYFIGRLMTVEE